MLSRHEFWSWVGIPGCSLPPKVATPKQNNCSWIAEVCWGEKTKISFLCFSSGQPYISYSKYFGDSEKLLMEFRFPDFQPWWTYPVQVIPGYALIHTQTVLFILDLLMPRGKMGKIMTVYANTSSRPHVLFCRCFKLVLVRNNFSLKMPKGNLVPIWEKMDLAVKQSGSSTSKNLVWCGPTSGQIWSEIVSLFGKYLSVTG